MTERRVLYCWSGMPDYPRLTSEQRTAVEKFLEDHGVNPLAFMLDSRILVEQCADGTLWFETWRCAGNVSAREAPSCESCPSCVKRERVSTLLVSTPPDLPSSFRKEPKWPVARGQAHLFGGA